MREGRRRKARGEGGKGSRGRKAMYVTVVVVRISPKGSSLLGRNDEDSCTWSKVPEQITKQNTESFTSADNDSTNRKAMGRF